MHITFSNVTWVVSAAVGLSLPAAAVECRSFDYKATSYSVCQVDLSVDVLDVFYLDRQGKPLSTFESVQREAFQSNRELLFAMNGGIFDGALRPVGLLIANGKQLQPLNLRGWPGQSAVIPKEDGNFYKLPNGVFWVHAGKAFVADSLTFQAARVVPTLALQSGPMLLKGGRIPDILHDYNARTFTRNGVCAPAPTTVAFAISNRPTSILEIAQFMRDEVKCADALYLDGCRSALFSKSLGRSDQSCTQDGGKSGLPMGPMVGVTGPRSLTERLRSK